MRIKLKAVGFNGDMAGIRFVDSVSQVEVGESEAKRLKGIGIDWEQIVEDCPKCKEWEERYEKLRSKKRESGN